MQRIDENTYIDDTLVTCAEYQLFIDEMREQGKYYQPDHWISYQFLQGRAREPILGVRYSDAVAFCKWLSKREARKWMFRLPTPIETKFLPLTMPRKEELLGYWVGEENIDFIWISATSQARLSLDINRFVNTLEKSDLDLAIINDKGLIPVVIEEIIEYMSKEDRTQNHLRIFNFKLRRKNINKNKGDFNLGQNQALTLIKTAIFVQASKVNYINAIIPDFVLPERNLSNIINIVKQFSSIKGNILFPDFETNNFIEIDPAKIIEGYPTNLRSKIMTNEWSSILESVILNASYLVREQLLNIHLDKRNLDKRNFGRQNSLEKISRELNMSLSDLLHIFIIGERIAGRSPAFEGIRLVRERIK